MMGFFGYRKIRGDGKVRALLKKLFVFAKALFWIDVPDANAPFRLMKVDIVRKYLYKMEYNYNLPNIDDDNLFCLLPRKNVHLKISFKARQER